MRILNSWRRRLGVTMVETALVMIIASAALAAGASLYADYLDNMTKRATAEEVKRVSKAFGKYLEDNHATLRPQVQANGGRMSVSVDDLKPDYLPDEFQNQSPFNQRYVFTVRQAASSDVLEGLVHTETISADYPMRTGDALEVARLVGATAGYTDPIDPQNVVSSYGQFGIDLADYGVNPGVGSIVSSLAVSGSTDAGYKYLHRSAMADPALNRMDTTLNMSGNNISGAGAIGADVVNAATSMQTGQLTASGAAITSLNAGNVAATGAISAAGNISGSSATVSGRVQAGSVYVPGAPIIPGGGDLAASSVHTSNWFRSHGNSGWYSQSYGGGWFMQDSTWIRAYGNKSVHTPGTMQAGQLTSTGNANVAGTMTSGHVTTSNATVHGTTTSGHVTTSNATVHGGVTVGGRVQANDVYATGWVGLGGACTAGQIARAGTSTVTCVNGRWAAGGGGSIYDMASCPAEMKTVPAPGIGNYNGWLPETASGHSAGFSWESNWVSGSWSWTCFGGMWYPNF